MTRQSDFWLDAAARILADVADDAKFAIHSGPQARIDHVTEMERKLESVSILLKATKQAARAAHAASA